LQSQNLSLKWIAGSEATRIATLEENLMMTMKAFTHAVAIQEFKPNAMV
jgi:hypothetical protein